MIPISAEYLANLRRRRPLPPPDSFAKVPRAKFDEHVAAVERQRDFAIGQRRAFRDWVSSYLDQRATALRLDAARQERGPTDKTMPSPTLTPKERRVVADILAELALDVERGPA